MSTLLVAREDGRWVAYDGTDPVGALRVHTRPDQRTHVAFQECRDDAYGPLLSQLDADLGIDLHASVEEDDVAGLQRFRQLGFEIERSERYYRVPLDQKGLETVGVDPPPGVTLVSAADADLDKLRLLDDTLRRDTPGADGWRWSPEEFRDETFSDGFDPKTYLVAVEQGTGDYLGLMRLWMRKEGPRFGFVGVLPRWRRTRVTYCLLATVFTEVHRRGWQHAHASIDTTNRASNGIAGRAGAVRVGGCHELRRPGRAA